MLKAYEILRESGIDTYIIDSQLILSKVLGKSKIELIRDRDQQVSIELESEYFRLISLRRDRMPVKYILEECEFMGLDFIVKEGVLIPRPDTEILVEAVISDIESFGYKNICDVCSGSGAIGISIASALHDTTVECLDISEKAEAINKANIDKFSLGKRVVFKRSDLLEEAIGAGSVYDAIVSNPPYIREDVIPTLMEDVRKFEPHIALCGGKSGLDFYERITEESIKCLRPGGLLAFEIGHDQKEAVTKILETNGFTEIVSIKDLAGLDRVVKGVRTAI